MGAGLMGEFTHHFGDYRSAAERHPTTCGYRGTATDGYRGTATVGHYGTPYETTWAHMPRQKPRAPSIISQLAGWFVAFLIAGTVLAWLGVATSKAVGQAAFDSVTHNTLDP